MMKNDSSGCCCCCFVFRSIFVIDLIYMLIIHNLCVGFFVLVFAYDHCVCVCYVWLQKSIDDIYSWPKLCCCCCWNCLATLIFLCHVFLKFAFFFLSLRNGKMTRWCDDDAMVEKKSLIIMDLLTWTVFFLSISVFHFLDWIRVFFSGQTFQMIMKYCHYNTHRERDHKSFGKYKRNP